MRQADAPLLDAVNINSDVKRSQLHKRIGHHYHRVMPDKKHHRIMIWVAFFTIVFIIAFQLLYPPDRALPFTRLSGKDIVWQHYDEVAGDITQSFTDSKLRLTIGADKTVETMLSATGADINAEAMVSRVTTYPFWQRFIPLSILFHASNITTAQLTFSPGVLNTFSVEQAKQLSFAPTNARLSIEKDKLVAVNDVKGSVVDAGTLRGQIETAQIQLGTTTLAVDSKRSDPKKTAADFSEVRIQAEAALRRNVTIRANGAVFSPDKATVASWLAITGDDTHPAQLSVDASKVDAYFDTIDKEAGTPAGQTNIDLVNGREVSRTTGANGSAINRAEMITKLDALLLKGSGVLPLDASFVVVAPLIIYDKMYTATEQGLQSYLDDLSKRMDVHVVVQQLDGQKWHASVRADESIPSASTFKLFVSKWLFDQIDQGKIHWDDPMLDTTVSGCFDRMTIASTNPCAYKWLSDFGRANMNQYVYDLGFSSGTDFTASDASHTTANDLEKMMLGLNDGSIINGNGRDRLLHNLSVHPYRYGVPTGSAGQVWDKVGFLWDYVHDAAIVQHPKGKYVVVIMTKGQSYATIANITREIEKIMYP